MISKPPPGFQDVEMYKRYTRLQRVLATVALLHNLTKALTVKKEEAQRLYKMLSSPDQESQELAIQIILNLITNNHERGNSKVLQERP